MTVPEDLQYTKSHEWVRIEGDTATIGITDHAQEELGGVVFVELPEEGTSIEAGSPFGVIESSKAVEDLHAPVSGEIVSVNEALREDQKDYERIDEDPYGDGWMIKVHISETGDLLSAEEYEQLLKEAE